MANKQGKHTPYYELLDAQRQAGCPVCRLARRNTDRYLDALLYESVLDPGLRDRLRLSCGFCAEHVAMLRSKPGRSLGIALIYEALLAHLAELLEKGSVQSSSLLSRLRREAKRERSLAARLTPQRPCPACAIQRQTAQDYIEILIAYLDDEALYTAYTEGEGLCLPHLAQAVDLVRDDATLQRLLEPQRARYRVLLADLAEFIRKSDHRFRHEELGPEGDVWLRAMNAVAGGAGLGLGREQSPRGSVGDSDSA